MRHLLFGTLLSLLFTSACSPRPAAANPASVLPLKTVRLYETGVGYFERTGNANLTSGTTLPVPAAHLDDALKTLVVLGADGQSRVGGLEFESSISEGMARALAGLSKEAGEPITHFSLLSSLKGEELEVKTANGTFTARLMEVIESPIPSNPSNPSNEDDSSDSDDADKANPPTKELSLLLLTNKNEIRKLASEAIQAIRPTSPATTARLGLALNTLSTRSAQSRRMVRVMAESKGPITLGYIAETPLWRTSYRIVLEDDKAVLQGWALLHNDTDEDWNKIRVQLVNGQPDSFLFPLAAPRYTRRELATPSEELSTIPQLLDQTPDAIWGDHVDSEQSYGGIGFGSIGSMGHGSGTGSGFGYGGGGMSRARGSTSSDLLAIGNLAYMARAEGIESGALFIYTLPQLLDLRAHGSALVPFIQSPVDAKLITWVDRGSTDARMAVRFSNDTKQTLPSGPIAFFTDGGFAGESSLDRLKPKEQCYIEFGQDIDVEFSNKTESSVEETKRLVYRNGSLEEHFVRKEELTVKVKNRSGKPRFVHWGLNVVTNAKVEGPDQVIFDTERSIPVGVFEVAARNSIEKEVRTEQGLSRSTALRSLDTSLLERMVSATTLAPEQASIIKEALKRRVAIDDTRKKQNRNEKSMTDVERDLERLREHLKALAGETGGVATNPFVRRILAAEDKLTELRGQKDILAEEEEGGFRRLEEVLESLLLRE